MIYAYEYLHVRVGGWSDFEWVNSYLLVSLRTSEWTGGFEWMVDTYL